MEGMRKEAGACAVLSAQLMPGNDPGRKEATDISRAVIELALRDPKIRRNA